MVNLSSAMHTNSGPAMSVATVMNHRGDDEVLARRVIEPSSLTIGGFTDASSNRFIGKILHTTGQHDPQNKVQPHKGADLDRAHHEFTRPAALLRNANGNVETVKGVALGRAASGNMEHTKRPRDISSLPHVPRNDPRMLDRIID